MEDINKAPWKCVCVGVFVFRGGEEVILIGLAYELTGIKEPMSNRGLVFGPVRTHFSCHRFQTLLTK